MNGHSAPGIDRVVRVADVGGPRVARDQRLRRATRPLGIEVHKVAVLGASLEDDGALPTHHGEVPVFQPGRHAGAAADFDRVTGLRDHLEGVSPSAQHGLAPYLIGAKDLYPECQVAGAIGGEIGDPVHDPARKALAPPHDLDGRASDRSLEQGQLPVGVGRDVGDQPGVTDGDVR